VVSGGRVWTPRPDPALTDPGRPGLRPHRHEPDHLYGWVFLQHQVWVDYWGNEHEIETMTDDYVANVILFCEGQTLGIALIVWAEIAYRVLLHRAGLGELPQPRILDSLADLEQIGQSGDGSLHDWLHELPLLRALTQRLDFSPQRGGP
jgi:hypothetical protein